MTKKDDNKSSHLKAWPAELEIEAYRKDLEASFLQEEATLEDRRREVIERLDEMEANTLRRVHQERDEALSKREEIMRSVDDLLESRYQEFVTGFDRDLLIGEMARNSLDILCRITTDTEAASP
jgi:hypothetical protein